MALDSLTVYFTSDETVSEVSIVPIPSARGKTACGAGTGLGLGMWSLATQQSTPLAQSPSTDFEGSVSPDGHWLAYTSRVTGRPEVYVTSFPKPGRQISNAGSTQAQWRADGRELFYVENDAQIMAVVVRTAVDAFDVDPPYRLFERRLTLPFRNRFVVTRDGQRFLVNTAGRRKRSESAANGGRQLASVGERRALTRAEGTRLAETDVSCTT